MTVSSGITGSSCWKDSTIFLSISLESHWNLRCEGIPLDEWALALQAIAQLEGGEGLSLAEVVVLKQRIRSLDVGTLLTVRAFNRYGPSRLAKELKELLEAEG